jgi:hypothetical protein
MNINVKAPTRMVFWLMILTCNSTQVAPVPNGEWRNPSTQIRASTIPRGQPAEDHRMRHGTDERRMLKLSQVSLFLINGARECVVCVQLELPLRGRLLNACNGAPAPLMGPSCSFCCLHADRRQLGCQRSFFGCFIHFATRQGLLANNSMRVLLVAEKWGGRGSGITGLGPPNQRSNLTQPPFRRPQPLAALGRWRSTMRDFVR